jgi:Flp pilus assembly protein TadD
MAPMSATAAYKLGLALLNLGKAAEATKELERAEQLRPGMPETLLALGKALVATGNSSEAEGALRKVVKAEPASTLAEAAHLQLSQLYRKLGRTADAAREIRALQELRRGRR